MVLFQSIASLILLGTVVLIHIATQLVDGILAKILTFVNIALHIAIIIPLLLDSVPIEEALLVYMISLFSYTLFSYFRHIVAVKKEGREAGGDI